MQHTRSIQGPAPQAPQHGASVRGAAKTGAGDASAAAQGGGFALLLGALGRMEPMDDSSALLADTPQGAGVPDGALRAESEAALADAPGAPDAFTLAALLAGQSIQAPPFASSAASRAGDAVALGTPGPSGMNGTDRAAHQGSTPDLEAPVVASLAGNAAALAMPWPSEVPGRGMAGAGLAAHQVGLGLARAASDSLVGETVALDGAADAATPTGLARPGGARPMGRANAQSLEATSGLDTGRSGRTGAVGLTGAGRDTASGLQGQAAAHPTAATTPGPATDAASRSPSPPIAPAALSRAFSEPGGMAAALASGATDLLRPGAGMAVGAGPGARTGEAAYAPDLQGPQGAMGESAGPAEGTAQPGMDTAESQLAERVAYWASQGTQNASVTVEGDGAAVQVQVALNGSEAHVTFHSDEAQARELLDAGEAELRALLQAQGLQLSGVTVGAGGSGGSRQGGPSAGDASEGRSRVRQGAVRAAEGVAGPQRTALRAVGVSQGTVDVFV